VKGGYVDETGTTVQPGGFMSAANMDLNVQTLNQIGGASYSSNWVRASRRHRFMTTCIPISLPKADSG